MAKKAVTTISTGGIGLDTTDFARFAKALRKAEPVLAKGLTAKLRAAGMVVAEEAKANIAPYSTTIPSSIKVRVSGATITVVAGGSGIDAIAGLLEIGNKDNPGGSVFRHPVFGAASHGGAAESPWVNQQMHPYLLPAVQSKADAAQALAVEALDEAIAVAVGEG